MIDINNLYVDLDLVLNKRAKLGNLLTPYELEQLKRKFEKNHWDDDTIVASIYRYLKENISDLLDNSDFIDANVIVESDPYIIKAMELMPKIPPTTAISPPRTMKIHARNSPSLSLHDLFSTP